MSSTTKTYHPNGKLYHEYQSVYLVSHGYCRWWYRNGRQMSDSFFNNGLRCGLYQHWSGFGKRTIINTNKENLSNGVCVTFNY